MNNGEKQITPYLHLDQKKEKILPVHPADYNGVAFPNAILMLQNGNVNFAGVLQYEFYNFSNVPVMINGMFLDRYFAATPTAPTYLNTRYWWIPIMLANEQDTSNYQVTFLDSDYPAINPFHRLYIIKKLFAPVPLNRQEQ